MALNSIQKEILDGIIKFTFETCEELNRRHRSGFKPSNELLTALNAIICSDLDSRTQELLAKVDILDTVNEIRNILSHPCPQNRRVGDPSAASGAEDGIIGEKVYYWVDGFGSILKHEAIGLLGLTAKNDTEVEPVTKKDVVNYLKHHIYSKIWYYNYGAFGIPMRLRNQVFLTSTSLDFNRELNCSVRMISISRGGEYFFMTTPSSLSKGWCSSEQKTIFSTKIFREDIISLFDKMEQKEFNWTLKTESLYPHTEIYGNIECIFIGKDPVMLNYIDFINMHLFNNEIPILLLNKLRDAIGQPLLDYGDNISYGDNVGTILQRKKYLNEVVTPKLTSSIFSSPKSASTLTSAEAITQLISDYDQNSSFDYKS